MPEESVIASATSPARIATLRLDARHLPQALALSQALNWPYRAEDWAFALALGRGFAVESDGRLAGTALWWPYGADHASAGMIIVAPDAQRRGIGGRLMDALLTDAAGRTIILNSTREGEGLYSRLGFVPYGAVTQHQAVLEQAPAIDPFVPLRAATAADRPALLALDRAASGMERGALLEALFAVSEVLVAAGTDGIGGYACVRRWGRGMVIGPVVAGEARQARALIAVLAARHVGGFVRIDVTADGGLAPWLEGIGLPAVDRVVAMSSGAPPPAAPEAMLYALSNQSLG